MVGMTSRALPSLTVSVLYYIYIYFYRHIITSGFAGMYFSFFMSWLFFCDYVEVFPLIQHHSDGFVELRLREGFAKELIRAGGQGRIFGSGVDA